MADNYILLERITVGATTAASVTFNNIPQTGYTDLKVVASARGSDSNPSRSFNLTVNGASSYATKYLQGSGSGASSGSNPYSTTSVYCGEFSSGGQTASTFGNTEIYIPNYTSTTNKSVSADSVDENNGTAAYATLSAGLINTSVAITTVTITSSAGNFVQYSTFSLYALAAVGTTPVVDPKALGGDIIQTDGTYWYHAFLSSGTFTPKTALTCDYLVVAGGGAGGASSGSSNDIGGGGGAGGLRSTVTATGGGGSLESALGLTANTAYTVTIGAGGSGGSASWTSGTNSVFSSITSTGGGSGGGLNTVPAWIAAATGGSGGGGDEANTSGAAGTANQGYAGGTSPGGPSGNAGGGGGGAGSVGANGTTNNGGAGGAGVAIAAFATATSTGVSNYYAGGGGGGGSSAGGAGGSGGGGAGAVNTATAGTTNTGGGGGCGNRAGSSGGSGIVIVRYLA